MINRIIYREYQESDFEDILNITLKTWEYEKYLSKDTAILVAELDLLCYLRECTFIYVAQANDKVIGFIIGRAKDNLSNTFFDDRIKALKRNINSRKEGLLIDFFRWKMSKINEKLIKKSKLQYDSELQFFAIDKDCRGLGIGRELFKIYKSFMESNGLKSFYLYTDTTCNYEFYDKYGLTRRETEKFKLPLFKRPFAKFYLYDNLR